MNETNKTPLGLYAAKLREILKDYIEQMEIDVGELESYTCHSYDQDYARFKEPDDEEWDEEEEWQAKAQQALDYIKADGWLECLRLNSKWQYFAMAHSDSAYDGTIPVYDRVQSFCEKYLESQAEGGNTFGTPSMWDEINKHLGV